MKSTLWIDLTDIEKWSGQHGGTQRVVYGIAEEYFKEAQKKDEDVRFFVFDESKRSFFVSDFEPIRQRVQAIATSLAEESQALSKKQKIQHYAVEYTPKFIRSNDKVRKALFKSAKIAYIQMGNVQKRLSELRPVNKASIKSRIIADFKKGDTILVLGKPWDFPAMTPALAELKEVKHLKLVAVVYDLIIPLYPHLHSPKLFKTYTQYMFEIIQAADLLLPISKSTDRDIAKFCKQLMLPKPTTKVIRLGDSLESIAEPKKPEIKVDKDFIVCVGTIEIRKNHSLLYYVYKMAQERGIKLPQLIIVGRLGWLASDVYHLFKKDKEIAKKVTILESVDDSELAWLYKNCLFSVYPSMYEGWGLPVAESLRYGKVAVATNASSVPEIAGDLLDYFSPYSVEQCLEYIVKYQDSQVLAKGEARIREKYNTTSWRGTQNQVVAAIKGIT